MALFWFGFGNPSVLFTIIVLVAAADVCECGSRDGEREQAA